MKWRDAVSDAPEQIWAAPSDNDGWHAPYAGLFECEGATEYIRADLARALIGTTAERDALRDRVAKLEAALALYSCEDGCNDCPEHERDRVSCGWTALTALQKDTPND
jgi:hypothetical protein